MLVLFLIIALVVIAALFVIQHISVQVLRGLVRDLEDDLQDAIDRIKQAGL